MWLRLYFEVGFFIRLLSHVENEDLLMISLPFLQTPITSAPVLLNEKKNAVTYLIFYNVQKMKDFQITSIWFPA